MKFEALATDGDGTLLRAGHMGCKTLAALRRWREAGGKVILVTGQCTDDLCDFPHHKLFDRIVAENGAILVDCDVHNRRLLAEPPPQRLVRALQRAKIEPVKKGCVVLETKWKHAATIRNLLAELDLGWTVVRNRDDLMIVPRGVSKQTGLATALKELGIAPRQVVAAGDAENDAPLLEYCGLGVALANAVPALKQRADRVTRSGFGKGVVEIIDLLISSNGAGPEAVKNGR